MLDRSFFSQGLSIGAYDAVLQFMKMDYSAPIRGKGCEVFGEM